MTFLHPTLGVTAAASAAVFVLAAAGYGARRRKRLLEGWLGRGETAGHTREASPVCRAGREILAAAACALVGLAAAGPHLRNPNVPESPAGRVVLVVDCSTSMSAPDPAPSRLHAARELARRIVADLNPDRAAIVAFAGEPFRHCPLTRDRDALEQALRALSPDTIARGGTDPEAAVREALRVLSDRDEGGALILLTDGEQLQGDLRAAAAACREANVVPVVIGFGVSAEGALIPGLDGEAVRDPDTGLPVRSALDAALLREFAAEAGGAFARAADGDGNVLRTLRETVPERTGPAHAPAGGPCHGPFLAAAMLLVGMRLLTGDRRRFPNPRTAAGLIAILAAAVPVAGAAEEPNRAPLPGAESDFAAGNALIRAGEYERGEALLLRALEHAGDDSRLRARIRNNAGVARQLSARLRLEADPAGAREDADRAERHYRLAMALDPDDAGVPAGNLALLRRDLRETADRGPDSEPPARGDAATGGPLLPSGNDPAGMGTGETGNGGTAQPTDSATQPEDGAEAGAGGRTVIGPMARSEAEDLVERARGTEGDWREVLSRKGARDLRLAEPARNW